MVTDYEIAFQDEDGKSIFHSAADFPRIVGLVDENGKAYGLKHTSNVIHVLNKEPLPAGANAIGKLAANSGVDIGDVDVLSIAAGENHLGQVGGEGDTIAQTPTITAGTYTANDNVGGLLEFANAARVSGGGGVINKVVIVDDAKQDAALELWLFDRTFTQGADNAAWSPSEADMENAIDVISTADGTYYDTANQGMCVIELARRYDLNGTSLFGRLVTRGTPTYAATDDLTVKVGVIQD